VSPTAAAMPVRTGHGGGDWGFGPTDRDNLVSLLERSKYLADRITRFDERLERIERERALKVEVERDQRKLRDDFVAEVAALRVEFQRDIAENEANHAKIEQRFLTVDKRLMSIQKIIWMGAGILLAAQGAVAVVVEILHHG
jgi:hypothetical protein